MKWYRVMWLYHRTESHLFPLWHPEHFSNCQWSPISNRRICCIWINMLQQTTSSSHCTQHNDKAEKAVKAVKRLFPKCKEFGQPEFKALLDRRKSDTQQHERRHAQQRQQFYYNKHPKPPQPINTRETMRIKLPGQKHCSAVTCLGQVIPGSYQVKVDESVYRRNRRELMHADEPRNPDTQ